MSDGRITLRDGRTLAWREYGPPGGRPILRFQGTPGSRYSRHPHEDSYDRLDARVIVFDRPGYGASTRLPGRGIAAVADDAAELLDKLGVDVVHVIGGSGGGPHALGFAGRHAGRVRAATVVGGAAPLEEDELGGMIGPNRDSWYAAHAGWDAMYEHLAALRAELLADPLASIRVAMAVAPESDKAIMEDPAWQRGLVEDLTEALRPGAEGLADEGMALSLDWDIDPADVRCSVTWWHGEHDANAPLAAVRRVLDRMQDVDFRVWADAGHFEPYLQHDEILAELLAR
jgi:pimeloyl-ACP methyl ester carboxylesterase